MNQPPHLHPSPKKTFSKAFIFKWFNNKDIEQNGIKDINTLWFSSNSVSDAQKILDIHITCSFTLEKEKKTEKVCYSLRKPEVDLYNDRKKNLWNKKIMIPYSSFLT